MKQTDKYRGKQVLVLGLGKSGYAVSKLLVELGAHVTVNDKTDLSDNQQAKQLQALGVKVISGFHPTELFEQVQFSYLVKNPGIVYENPMVQAAMNKGVPVITEPEVALEVSDAPYVCVTGSNGKTTTVMLTQQILDHHLAKAGHHAYAVGNIGVAISEVVKQATSDDILVVELSSFQLMGMPTVKPKVAAIVDIYDKVHLDYHHSFDNYVNAKLQITKCQSATDYFLANFDQKDILQRELSSTKANVLKFSLNDQQADFYANDEWLMKADQPLVKIADIKLPGKHNIQNSLVASAISLLMGAEQDDLQAVLSTFAGARHRLQFVKELRGRKFYNDSKSTNIEAATVALSSFKQPEVWIAGGLDRGFTFESLEQLIAEHVKTAIFYGETKHLLAQTAQKAGVKEIKIVDNLEQAVQQAYQLSTSGDIVLLSPACASWDQFKTFEERGDRFIEYVEGLK